ncbi:MAG TPA: SUF system NifU family Fe-S cluster assembly protein [Actinomycetales bacterium]|nr:SUF system NifU family Fe-S cluster assembly protein [Actinomycetales bacterium]
MDLYQELILEHSKHPQGEGLREPFDAEVHHVNPTCGDEVTLRVRLRRDAAGVTLDDVSYDSQGCAISRASASVLHALVVGEPLDQVARVHEAMRRMLTSRGKDPGSEDVLGDGVALAGVAKYPARVKCALLSWMALTDALAHTAATDVDGTDPLGGRPHTDRPNIQQTAAVPATGPSVAAKEDAR